ncbi:MULTISPECIES: serine/threonine-protein kinase [Actinoalloteichus]|uniref:non-specific serine/threonine protein kinase n=1 Tax=Actinoalloteichus fjordicus TaxID=1612552 RepID=A0AAC9LK18_9PSEU|nr:MULTISPECIES: serine/threonine-protein kinase [Actinoalloteichus]APU17710.1 serine/threonine protein kinase [Actinoalloteichus fjordicus]APU23788.1 serine/threonine protein kinase [Actinoalloteichus sp. GBA129-24]
MSEDLTGRRLGHYRITGVLGRGGMSVMYRATDERLGRKVALKVIAEHLSGDGEFRERFVDEARNTSAIDHAHVVPLYDFGEVDGLLYIAMRLVDGADLAEKIKDGPLSPTRCLDLLGQVAEALDMLNGRGLVHLDIKPANVLVTSRESSGEHVYLADFGLTRRGATGHRTQGGDFLGSPTYAAPEHLRGEPVDPRTDAYSLACVLFACLTGRPPYRGQVSEVIEGHLAKPVPSVTSVVALPPAIDEVLRRGMNKDPKQRYANCRELIATARTALASTPRPDQPPAPAQPDTGSRPALSGAGLPPGAAPQGSAPQGLTSPGPTSQGAAWGQQSFPATPGAGQQYVGGAPMAEPMRLRPPSPAQSAASFTGQRGGGNRWVLPILVGAVVLAVTVLVIVLINGAEADDQGLRAEAGVERTDAVGGVVDRQEQAAHHHAAEH